MVHRESEIIDIIISFPVDYWKCRIVKSNPHSTENHATLYEVPQFFLCGACELPNV